MAASSRNEESNTSQGKKRVFKSDEERSAFVKRQGEGASFLLERSVRVQSESWEIAGHIQVER